MTRRTWTCACGAQRTTLSFVDADPPLPQGWRRGPQYEPVCADCRLNLTPIFTALCKQLRVVIVRAS